MVARARRRMREDPRVTARRSMALCFALGSTCVLVGPFPGYAQLVGESADAVTFFVGSILFTAGGALQSRLAWGERGSPGGRAAWSSSSRVPSRTAPPRAACGAGGCRRVAATAGGSRPSTSSAVSASASRPSPATSFRRAAPCSTSPRPTGTPRSGPRAFSPARSTPSEPVGRRRCRSAARA